MHSLETQQDIANNRLEEYGMFYRGIEDINLPTVDICEDMDSNRIPYVVLGECNAENLVFVHTPYSTSVVDRSIQMRLKAQQVALGGSYCVVGVTTYDPQALRLDPVERDFVRNGEFDPLTLRMYQVVRELQPTDDQTVSLYGFSMGADVATELAHHNLVKESYGEFKVANLGVFEAARVKKRALGRVGMVLAMNVSGNDLFSNVMASNMPALLEARGIDPRLLDRDVAAKEFEKARKAHMKEVTNGVIGYTMFDLKGVLSIIKGFAHGTTAEQLLELHARADAPRMVAARAHDSKVFAEDAFARLPGDDKLTKLVLPGDHSIEDDLTRAAAHVRFVVGAR